MGSLVRPIEPWHVRYWAGDDVPDAVLAYERGKDDDMDSKQALLLWNLAWCMQRGVMELQDPVNIPEHKSTPAEPWSAPAASVANKLAQTLAKLGEGGALTPADVLVIKATVAETLQAEMPAFVEAVNEETRDAVADLGEGGATAVRDDAE